MTLFLVLVAMTVAALLAVIWPLARRAEVARSGSDVDVYRDQLDELDRDLTAGLIGKTEADAARVEISRRLLAAADVVRATAQSAVPAVSTTAWRRRAVAVASLVVLPVIAGSFYLQLGAPELASAQAVAQGSAAAPRGAAPADKSIEALVEKAEAHLQSNPEDGRAWEVLAPVYMRLDRYADSITAWRNTLQLLGENAERDADLGEALTAEADGVVTQEAKTLFVKAEALDETLVSARYYLGLSAEQDGRREEAAKIWRELIAQAPADAEWVGAVREALVRVESNALPGPSATQMAAAANQPPEQQTSMIQTMVDRLAARLKQDGTDAAGWAQLIHSYNVLGQTENARAATAEARQALAGDSAKLAQLDAALKGGDTDRTAAVDAPAPVRSSTPAATPVSDRSGTQTAAADQPPPQHDIQPMVDRLAARLKQDGSDVVGWVQLIRSYNVLGQADKAQAATADARQALAGDAAKLAQFETALKGGDAAPAASGATAAPGTDKAAPTAPAGAPPDHEQAANMQIMVDRLAERLKTSGSDPAGWLMLVRSYATLGEKDKATAAIGGARQALADDPTKLEQFNNALKTFHISE
jgi:cytochrome c-type biogenesis protein CcmH